MLNYRAAPPGQKILLQQVLDGQVTADMVRSHRSNWLHGSRCQRQL
ncbi:hypothetical protein [Phormidesmis sp. 146-33]